MRDRTRSADACAQAVWEHQTPVISAHSAGLTACVRKGAPSKPHAKDVLSRTLEACSFPLNFLCQFCESNCRLFLALLPAFAP